MIKKLAIISLFLVALAGSGFSQDKPLDLGNPSRATTNKKTPNNYLVEHKKFTLSYNKSRGAPNWVAWHLSASDIGDTERSDFIVDSMLPAEWRIKKSDYNKSGYDRGHMCPSKDRSETVEDNQECFVMSNMEPQTPALNRRAWKNLEEFTRNAVRAGNEAYVFAGCYGNAGTIKGKVTIPTRCFKIILVLPEGNNDLSRIKTSTRTIAVDLPNTNNVDPDWKKQKRVSIDDIEKATGFDFLSKLPDKVEAALEKKKTAE